MNNVEVSVNASGLEWLVTVKDDEQIIAQEMFSSLGSAISLMEHLKAVIKYYPGLNLTEIMVSYPGWVRPARPKSIGNRHDRKRLARLASQK